MKTPEEIAKELMDVIEEWRPSEPEWIAVKLVIVDIQRDAFESGVQKYRPAWAKAMDHIIDSPCHCKPEEQYEPCHRCQTLKTISDLLEPSDQPTPNPLKIPSL